MQRSADSCCEPPLSGYDSSDDVEREWETERERLLREYQRLELEVAAERHLLLDSSPAALTQQTLHLHR